jgi:integrase/recombinase XerC
LVALVILSGDDAKIVLPLYTRVGIWNLAIAEHSAHMVCLGIRPATITLRRYQLGRVGGMLGRGPWEVTAADLAAWAGSVGHWSANTRRSYRTTLRGFYRWAVEAGHVDGSPALALPRVRPAPPNPRPAPETVYRAALGAATPRERLMLRLAAEHGLRRGEVALVHSRDLEPDLDAWALLVHGKGGKERLVPLLDDVAGELRRLPAGFAFPGDDHGHLSPAWVGKLINRLLADEWTIHKLRHRAATCWWEVSDHDVYTVQELLGHADPRTTKLYVKVPTKRLREVVTAAA